jgi:hypothetical protein
VKKYQIHSLRVYKRISSLTSVIAPPAFSGVARIAKHAEGEALACPGAFPGSRRLRSMPVASNLSICFKGLLREELLRDRNDGAR